jgi:hypothetical protein
MKCCAIIFHKNAISLYRKDWIRECLQSIESQTHADFDILELNYGNDKTSIMDVYNIKKKRLFWTIPKKTHAQAMNFLLEMAFKKYNYDFVFNVNIDDFYDKNRFKIQLGYHKSHGFEICSSNYSVLSGNHKTNNDYVKIPQENKYIKKYLDRNLNIICHPSICFYKTFWKKTPEICYHDEVPREDVELWKRCLDNNVKIIIVPEYLTVYRKHPNQITQLRFND